MKHRKYTFHRMRNDLACIWNNFLKWLYEVTKRSRSESYAIKYERVAHLHIIYYVCMCEPLSFSLFLRFFWNMRRFVCIHPFFCVYCLLFKKWATFAWELASKRSSLKSVDVSRCCAPMELHSHCECQTFLFACRRICAFLRCIKVELCDKSTVFVLLEKYRVFRNGFILKTQWTEVHIWLSHFRFI